MKKTCVLALLALVVAATRLMAATVPDRKGAVLQDRANLQADPRWIYEDYERGFAEAQRTGKPLLVVLRCIPCLACGGLDARVLLENTDLSPLLDQFVCVRVINANALDLNRFQFDFDLSFSALIFNGDGTLYGRYGSWAHQKDPEESATDGFRAALETALELHRNYPDCKPSLAGKQPRPGPYQTPLDLPELQGRYPRNLDWEGRLVQSCVHCHQIGEALRAAYREEGKSIPSNLVHPFPPPETLGFELAQDHKARVKEVLDGSVAAKAGLRPGDDLSSLDGQPILSIADVSWVLHNAPDSGTLEAEVHRGNNPLKIILSLPDGWRDHSDISRRVGTWSMRAMALGGLKLEDLNDEERSQRGLASDQLALLAQHVGEYGKHAVAKKAGFQKSDILVAVAGLTVRRTEGELIAHLLREYRPGDRVNVTVLRGQEKLELELPMQ